MLADRRIPSADQNWAFSCFRKENITKVGRDFDWPWIYLLPGCPDQQEDRPRILALKEPEKSTLATSGSTGTGAGGDPQCDGFVAQICLVPRKR